MALELVAQGDDLNELRYNPPDEAWPEGQRGVLYVYSPGLLTGTVATALRVAGVDLWEPVTYDQTQGAIRIPFRKGFPWLVVIVGALILLGIIAVSWVLYKVADVLPIPQEWIDFLKANALPIAVGVVALLVVPRLLRR